MPDPTEALDFLQPPAGLFLVATPIGNARDITLRALDALKSADLILAEDTRVTSKLLAIYGISTTLWRCDDHVGGHLAAEITARIGRGQRVALVSDAGTPLVSDPGYKLVRTLMAAGLPVTALPGPCAAITALQLSALPPDRFLFAGFPPARSAARQRWIADLAGIEATLILYESAQRLPECLADLADGLGPRPACVARELTKRFEEMRRGPLDALAAHYAEAGPPRGEVVVVIGAPDPAAQSCDPDALLTAALREHGVKEAAALVAQATGRKRQDLYRRALELKGLDAKGITG